MIRGRLRRLACLLAALPLVSAAGAEPQPAAEAQPSAAEAPAAPDASSFKTQPQLLVEDLRPGPGEIAQPGMTLVVHYTGWFYEPASLGYRGPKFDSSRDRGVPLTFVLGEGRVIQGWEKGLVGMRVGGLRRLVIPPELAYGDRGAGRLIPPGATLVFEVELLGIESSTLTENSR